ncbi:elongation of very long chain fatty acids protein 7-like [Phlebotomus argentipes]|uniref:elongation of very long chain fatty acids protein 7-like n=1 Tax=Phlebotomus argentipes TaxID=94469 RepID=UPI002892ABCD|nr:elongation of very long chain fatty acids protein 7-like [Phlebotomus argentipes]
MAQLITRIIALYHYVNDELSDPRTSDYPMMKNPLKLLILLGLYLYFVLELGPKIMEKRKPFNLERILIVFNVAQIAICSYLLISAMIVLISVRHNWLCQPLDYSSSPNSLHIVKLVYYYFLTKVLDLLDTVFFVLRKKNTQISFLHVYHHGGMLVATWIGVKYLPGGHNVTLGVVNAFVHVAMYSYYLLSSLSFKYKNNLWWKKHITQLQLIQFLILTVHYLLLFFIDCDFPKFTAYFMVPQNIFMLAMFGDFYYRAYVSPKATPAEVKNSPDKANHVNGNFNAYFEALKVNLDEEDYGEKVEDHKQK